MRRLRVIFLLVFCVCAVTLGFIVWVIEGDGLLKVYFLDVGQGDAIYIRTPQGKSMLMDGGPSAAVLQKLSRAMPWIDRSIDVVIESHPDADHIGGLPEIVRRYDVGMFLEPGIESKNAIDDELHRLVLGRAIPDILARRGMRINFGDGVVFDILFPNEDVVGLSDTNTASIVGQVRFGSTSIMLTGDSPKEIENRLVPLDGDRLRSNILKAGHHGSRTSSGKEYISSVDPSYAIISAGKDNRYGHPHAEVIDLFKQHGVQILRTSDSGTIRFVSDGKTLTEK